MPLGIVKSRVWPGTKWEAVEPLEGGHRVYEGVDPLGNTQRLIFANRPHRFTDEERLAEWPERNMKLSYFDELGVERDVVAQEP